MSSADQDWSEAIKASIENATSPTHCTSSKTRQDTLADFLPTSSQSPGSSPQASPDSQQTHLQKTQHRAGLCTSSQDQQISQSCVQNTSQSCDQASSSDKTRTFEPESQQHQCPAPQHITNKVTTPRLNESNNSSNYPIPKPHAHLQELSQKNQSQSQGGTLNPADKNVTPSFSTKHPQNQYSDHHQTRLSTPNQASHQRPSLNASTAPHHLQAARMTSSPRQTNSQQFRQSIPHQNQPHQPFIGFRQPQQAQQRMLHQQQQRPLNPGLSGAGNVYPGKRMTTPGSATAVRPHNKVPHANHPYNLGQAQGTRPVNQNQTQVSMGTTGQAPKRTDTSGVSRMWQQQGHPQAFSNPHHQGAPHHLQNIESDDRMPQGTAMPHREFEDEAMYYDDEEEEDEEEMDDIDEEEMEYSRFQNSLGYGYPSSDSDELSEEESALLEELRCCDDDLRYEEIVSRLREKGVDPEEIEEMLYHSNYPQEMYPGENYDDDVDDEDDGEDDDAEGTVSSSSQGQAPYMRNQMRPQMFHSSAQNQSRMYPQPPVGQNQKETSAPSPMLGQPVTSVPSIGFNPQGMSHSITAVSTDSINQPGKVSGFQGLAVQPHQKNPDSVPNASSQMSAQEETLQFQQQQQQPELKNIGQGNQQKKIFQGSTIEASQSTSQTSGWQPLQNIVRAQHPLTPGDSRQPASKTIPQPGHFQAPRTSMMNRPPQPHNQAQGQIGAPRSQSIAQSNSSGILVRPVHHLTIMTNNNQATIPGQGGQNRPLIVRQTAPVQQLVITSLANNQQGGFVGMPLQSSPVVRPACPRTPLHMNQKLPVTPASQNLQQQQQNVMQSPKLKAVLDKETAPSEASLARLNVMYMQQILDKEIMAKKGTQPSQGQSSGSHNPTNQNVNLQNRFSSPQNTNQVPNGQTFQSQKQLNPTFPAYQPKHQLPPRQPIPAIVNPNSSTNQTSSGGKPVCSVVPFTAQNCGQAMSTNVPRQNTPQQNVSSIRPRNPAPLSPQNINSSPQPSPGMLPNRMSMPAVTSNTAASSSAGSNVAVSKSLTQGTMAPLVSTQTVPQQLVFDQVQQQQQSQITNFKSETFSLDHLSEDKCIITGKGKQQGLTVNMVYQIRSPKDNSLILALWNGERFEDLKHSDVKSLGQSGQMTLSGSQPNQKLVSDLQKTQTAQQGQTLMTSETDRKEVNSSAVPVSTSKFQAEFMQSLTLKNDEDDQSFSGTESHPHQGYSGSNELGQTPDVRMQKNPADVAPNQSTYIKPLPQAITQPKNEEEDDDDSVFKKPFNENEDYFRVCQYCGYTSKNFKRCEGCKRVFQGEVKIHSLKKQTTKTIPSGPMSNTSNPKPLGSVAKKGTGRRKAMAGQEFSDDCNSENSNGRGRGRGSRGRSGRTRGGGVKGRMGVKGTPGENFDSSDSDESLVDRKRISDGSGSSSEGSVKRRPARPKAKNPTPRKRSKKADEPVTVTISSDEDEPSSTSNNMANHAPSPAHSAGSESPIFPSMPVEPINAFGRFRRVLMEDEEGHSKLSKKMQQHIEAPLMDRLEEDEEDDEDDDGDEPPTYEIDIRSVRIGSMRTQPEGPLLINLQGVCFKVRSERTEEAFECEIMAQDVEQVKFFSGQTQPVLFLFLTPESGEILRGICHMEPGDDEYFDPSSTDMKQKMVVIIIECFNYMPHEMLRETLSLWADLNHVEDECFIEELTEESANDLLIQSAPPVLTADVERDVVKFKQRYLRDVNNMSLGPRMPGSPSDSTDNEPDSTSSSPPEIRHYFGPSIRLLQYPPPPARGIPITTEDLFCLTEGEFLNDVIIDFYLQYLYQEKLTEENRRRTHIFSSFFYKRLTQRDRHSEKTEEDAKKTVAERRHARVKKWTKTVDLFSKDFIIVPINEHSHWYLAVICFPGLANPEVVPFIPSDVHRADFDDESNDNNGEERNIEDNGSQDSLPKTILGQQLNAKHCLDNEDSKYNIGQKQPCILVFDSLAGPSRTPNIKMLKEYLQCEWSVKKTEVRNIAKILRGSTPKVPQQSNYSDCGVYLLQYVESFFEDPIADFQIPMKGLQNWFSEELVQNKRRDIHDLIMSLHRRYQEERGDPRILDIKFESTPREPPLRFPQNPEMNSRPEEGMFSGFNRDDESSNSSMSGDMSRSELASGSVTTENTLFSRSHCQPGNQHGLERQKDDEDQDDQDSNDYEDNIEKQKGSYVFEHE